jgi:hypothetical protein
MLSGVIAFLEFLALAGMVPRRLHVDNAHDMVSLSQKGASTKEVVCAGRWAYVAAST